MVSSAALFSFFKDVFFIDILHYLCYNSLENPKKEILKMKSFKERVLSGEFLCGTHISLNDTCIAKIVGLLGFDYIWIDMEHSYLTYENLLNEMMILQAMDVPVVVRVPQHDLTATKKILEMGPDGIVFPMVRSKEEMEELLSMSLYPPYGKRGFGPGNAISYGISDVKEFVKNHHKTMCRFVQIEHVDLVNQLDQVVTNPYVDGFIFGANDLSGSIGELTNIHGENVQSLITKSIEILKKNNKCIGLSTDEILPEQLRFWKDLGINMISAGAERSGLVKHFRAIRKAFD